MKVGELAARLARCDQEATIYTIVNGVRYHPELFQAAGDLYITQNHEKRIQPGHEIVATRSEVSQESENSEN